jgi:hypothetical protein
VVGPTPVLLNARRGIASAAYGLCLRRRGRPVRSCWRNNFCMERSSRCVYASARWRGVEVPKGAPANSLGIIAASINKLSDCDGDYYYASLHIGATAWYLMASLEVNPFQAFSPATAVEGREVVRLLEFSAFAKGFSRPLGLG